MCLDLSHFVFHFPVTSVFFRALFRFGYRRSRPVCRDSEIVYAVDSPLAPIAIGVVRYRTIPIVWG